MTKVCGHGQAAVLNREEVDLLFKDGFQYPRDRALFGICLYSGCRISEALQLHTSDVKSNAIVFRKGNTKGKLATREVRIIPPLAAILADYRPKSGWYFPGKRGVREVLSRGAADKILKLACKRIGIEGVSTHSFRRTSLTIMSASGVPLRTIQKISGHRDLGVLQEYLEVSDQQIEQALLHLQF